MNALSTLKDLAYETIKRKIITCEIMPGDVISANELSKTLNIGRTPIREAFNKLENENLVKIHAKQGITVTNITVKDILDLYTINEILEPSAAKAAAEKIDLDLLGEYKLFYEDSNHSNNDPNYIKKARDFHFLVNNCIDNPILTQALMDIYDNFTRIRIFSRMHNKERTLQARSEHLELIDAFYKRDEKLAEDITRRHIKNAKDAALLITKSR